MLQDTPSQLPKKINVKPALVSLLLDAEVFPQGLLPRHGCADGPVPLDA